MMTEDEFDDVETETPVAAPAELPKVNVPDDSEDTLPTPELLSDDDADDAPTKTAQLENDDDDDDPGYLRGQRAAPVPNRNVEAAQEKSQSVQGKAMATANSLVNPRHAMQQQILSNNADFFKGHENNEILQDQLALAGRFRQSGMDKAWQDALNSEKSDSAKEKVLKNLTSAEAAHQFRDYHGKDRSKLIKDRATELMGAAEGLVNLKEFQPPPPKAKEPEKPNSETSYLGAKVVGEAIAGIGGTIDLLATGADWAHNKWTGASKDEIATQALNEGVSGFLHNVGQRIMTKGRDMYQGLETEAHKATVDEFNRKYEKAGTAEWAAAYLFEPTMWLDDGAGLLGQLASGGGAGSLVKVALVRGAQRAAVKATGAKLAGEALDVVKTKAGKVSGAVAGAAFTAQGTQSALEQQSFWQSIDKDPNDFSKRKQQKIFQDVSAALEAKTGKSPDDKTVSDAVEKVLKHEQFAGQLAWQGLFTAIGIGPSQVIAKGVFSDLAKMTAGTGKVAGMAATGAANAAQSYASEWQLLMQARQTVRGDTASLSDKDREDDAALTREAIKSSIIGAPFGAIGRGKTAKADKVTPEVIPEVTPEPTPEATPDPSLFSLSNDTRVRTPGDPNAKLEFPRSPLYTPVTDAPALGDEHYSPMQSKGTLPENVQIRDDLETGDDYSTALKYEQQMLESDPEMHARLTEMSQTLVENAGVNKLQADAAAAFDSVLGEGAAAAVEARNASVLDGPRQIDAVETGSTSIAHTEATAAPAVIPEGLEAVAPEAAPILLDSRMRVVAEPLMASFPEAFPDGQPDWDRVKNASRRKNISGSDRAALELLLEDKKAKDAALRRQERKASKRALVEDPSEPFRDTSSIRKLVTTPHTEEAKLKSTRGTLSVVQAKEIATDVGKRMQHLGIAVDVHRTMDEYLANDPIMRRQSDEAKARFKAANAGADAFMLTVGGKHQVVALSDSLPNAEYARYALEHEIFGHVGPEVILGQEGMRKIRDEVYLGIHNKDPELTRIWNHVEKNYAGASPAEKVDEVIARIARSTDDTAGTRNVLMRYAEQAKLYGFNKLFDPTRLTGNSAKGIKEIKDLLATVHEEANDPKRSTNRITESNSKGYAAGIQEFVNGRPEALVMTPWQKFVTKYLDGVRPVAMSMKAMLSNATPDTQLAGARAELSLRNIDSKSQIYVDGQVRDRFIDPLMRSVETIASANKLSADITMRHLDEYLNCKHTPERNRWLQLQNAPLSEAGSIERSRIINGALADFEARRGPAKTIARIARQQIEALVDKETNEVGHKFGIENVAYAGQTNSRAAAKLEALRRDQPELFAAFEELNTGLIQGLRGKLVEHAHESGEYHPLLTAFAQYDNYVPQMGSGADGFVDGRVSMPGMRKVSQFNSTRVVAEGRTSAAEHGLMGLMDEAARFGAQRARNEFANDYRAMIAGHNTALDAAGDKTTRRFGTPEEHRGIRYGGEEGTEAKFDYPSQPKATEIGDMRAYDPATGKHYTVALHDINVAEALARSAQSDVMTGAERFGRITNGYAKLLATQNPAFVAASLLRDVQGEMASSAFEYQELRKARGQDDSHGSALAFNANLAYNVLSKTMAGVLDVRSPIGAFFRATAGGRDEMVARWTKDGKPAGIDDKTYQHLKEFYDDGGIIGMSKGIYEHRELGQLSSTRNTLHNAVRDIGQTAAKSLLGAEDNVQFHERLGQLSEFVDSQRRFTVYTTLRSLGMSQQEASMRARNSMDFSRRGAFFRTPQGRMINAAFMFTGANLAAVSHIGDNRIWRNGKAPTEVITLPDGRSMTQLRDGWHKEINPWLALTMMGSGAAMYGLNSMFMGDDEDGEANIKRVPLHAWGTSNVVATSATGYASMPQQYGLQRIFQGLGAMSMGVYLGHHEIGDIAPAQWNSTVEQLLPVSPLKGLVSAPGNGTYASQVVRGLAPDILKPLVAMVSNEKWTGDALHRTIDKGNSKPAAYSGYSTTPEIFKSAAQGLRDDFGLDVFPETLQYLVEQFGIYGHALDKTAKAFSANSATVSAAEAANIILPVKQNDTTDTYDARALKQVTKDVVTPLIEDYNIAKSKGTEKAFLAAHKDFPAIRKANRSYRMAIADMSKQLDAAAAAGDQDRAQAIRLQKRKLDRQFRYALGDRKRGVDVKALNAISSKFRVEGD